jgi:peptide/nickel transport system substrate-binding protein
MTDKDFKLDASRRTVLGGAAAAGAAAAMGPTILGGTEAKASDPQAGGTLRVGLGHGSTTDSLDPATYENGFSSFMGIGGLFNYITAVDETNQLAPELAEEWEATPNAMTWTFKIREGVEFHNGKTMTPDDIVGSLNYHRGPDSVSAISSLFEQVTDIQAKDNTVVISLNAGNADFPYIMSDYHLGIQPTEEGAIVDPHSGIGAGSYMLVEYEPGVAARLERNPNYWKSNAAWFDDVELTTIADPAARQNAILSGQVDVIDRVDTKTAHLLELNPNVDLVEATGTLHYTMPFRSDSMPYDDNNVRMAMKHAIDRDDLVDKILRGHGVAGQDTPITPANRFYATDIEVAGYDPEKARWYMDQSDYAGQTFELSASDAAFVGAVDAAVIVKEHAAAAGINIDVIREVPDGYWSEVWMQKPWCFSYWGGRPTEDWMFSTAYSADAPWNEAFWSNDRFNVLLIEARAELNEDLRREMYREMQQIMASEGGSVIPMYANNVDAATTGMGHGPNIGGNWSLDGNRLMERWWFNEPTA